jgi:hypothetical protein
LATCSSTTSPRRSSPCPTTRPSPST